MRSLSVGVVGAGTAGSAAALGLHRRGHRVRVYEAVADPQPKGAGITLQPSGMSALGRLGLLQPILERGSVLEGIRCVTPAGRDVLSLDYAMLHPGAFGLGIHRGVLFQTLLEALKTEGIPLQTGARVASIQPGPGGRRALLNPEGEILGEHELVVVADGSRSQLRAGFPMLRSASRYPYGALWFIGDDPEARYPPAITQIVDGTHRMLGFLPTGTGPSGDRRKVSLFWSLPLSEDAPLRARGLEAWKDEARGMSPLAEPLLEQLESLDQLLLAPYHDVVMWPWHHEGVVFLGDAAHATSPQLGQGANLALVDAEVLCACLLAAEALPEALAQYSRQRRSSLRYYQFVTRWLTPFFQSDRPLLGWLRDRLMPWSRHVPYVRRRMLQGMCGLETGFLRRAQAMPLLEDKSGLSD